LRPAQRVGPVPGGHVQHGLGVEGRGIARGHLLEQGGHIPFGNEVQGIIAGRAIGAKAHPHPGGAQGGDRGNAAGKLHVALGAVGHARAGGGQDGNVVGVEGHAVGEQRPRAEKAQVAQVRDDSLAMGVETIVVFPGCFHGMGGQQQTPVPDEPHAPRQRLGRAGIDGVGEDAHPQPVMAVKLIGQGLGRLQGGLGIFENRILDLHDALADDGPEASGVGRVGHGPGEEVGVEEAGGAGSEHLGASKLRPQSHGLGVHPGFGGPDVFGQPHGKGRVVAKAAKKRHGRVGMGVDKSGKDHGPGQVEDLPGDKSFGQVGDRAHGRDAAVDYGQGGLVQDLPGFVLGQYGPGRKQHVARDG